jgi:hypothetical protein
VSASGSALVGGTLNDQHGHLFPSEPESRTLGRRVMGMVTGSESPAALTLICHFANVVPSPSWFRSLVPCTPAIPNTQNEQIQQRHQRYHLNHPQPKDSHLWHGTAVFPVIRVCFKASCTFRGNDETKWSAAFFLTSKPGKHWAWYVALRQSGRNTK